ncbi:MAG: hypothetical protein NT001_03535 [Candidatus Woesearchaeota archaeon]|nr:hypothetical protein [Candidatus Woesearchaeota archaeon]
MKLHKSLFNIVIGILLIVLGIIISIDFILKFALAAIGIFLIMLGMSFLMRR